MSPLSFFWYLAPSSQHPASPHSKPTCPHQQKHTCIPGPPARDPFPVATAKGLQAQTQKKKILPILNTGRKLPTLIFVCPWKAALQKTNLRGLATTSSSYYGVSRVHKRLEQENVCIRKVIYSFFKNKCSINNPIWRRMVRCQLSSPHE